MKTKKEKWKAVEGYKGLYEVSNLSKIKSLSRIVARKGEVGYMAPERILSPRINGRGYYACLLFRDGKGHSFYIHRLVAMAFIPNPENKRTVNHINGIKTDNRIENLEWATDSENILHSYNSLGRKHASGHDGERHTSSKSVIQLALDGTFIARFGSGREAGRAGFNRGHISSCCLGKVNTHKGYKWVFEDEYKKAA